MSSGGNTIPSSLLHSTNFTLPSLFPQTGPFKIPGLSSLSNTHSLVGSGTSPQRIKTKRVRQRVDAGEPRNSYQNTNRTSLLQTKYTKASPIIPSMLNNNLTNNDTSSPSVDLFDYTIKSLNNTIMDEDNFDMLKEEFEDESKESSPNNSITSSASKRKSFLPKQLLEDQIVSNNNDSHEGTNSPTLDNSGGDETLSESGNLDILNENSRPLINNNSNSLNNNLSINSLLMGPREEEKGPDSEALHKFNEAMHAFDAQRRFVSTFIEQNKKNALFEDSKRQLGQQQNGMTPSSNNRDYAKFAATLKQEIVTSVNGSIEKVLGEFIQNENQKFMALGMALNHQQNNTDLGRSPLLMQSLHNNPYLNGAGPTNGHSLPNGGGIFPTNPWANNFNPFATSAILGNMSSLMGMRGDENGGPPRKKRSKVTDTIRVSRFTSGSQNSGSQPNSARSSPQLASYLPPSLINPSMYSSSNYQEDREPSPTGTGDFSDTGTSYDGPQNTQLTPMHLRKAKLMFFWTRYPSSAVIKSYFPDVRFNKGSISQAVKWLSNFREFFYAQIEKFARQALAEGIQSREDIVVTRESEIFKNLNQHYNRNNHVQPPERFHLVIQETLREFFCSIQHGKDADPSWKKSIYKIINRLDETVPEYFKEPDFLERLE
uniref:Prospero domain-containing protein n=1 Tax=Rhabditophanes sp. KR3021 TaxID=114890 RepID=A0AC35TI74_9BILA